MKRGDIVFLKPGINHYEKEILEAEIIRVGRKYFEIRIKGHRYPVRNKYEIATLREVTEYTPNYFVYLNKQDILDEKEFRYLRDLLRSDIMYKKISLEQLRKVHEIVYRKEE